MLTCGELLVRLLEDLGVDTVFGIPVCTPWSSIGDCRDAHPAHHPRHEQGAGSWRTDMPGCPATRVCFIITGPGMTNILTAMGQAYGDSIPMLVISSVNNTEQLGMGWWTPSRAALAAQFGANVTAFSHTLMRPDELPAILTRAFAISEARGRGRCISRFPSTSSRQPPIT